MSRLEISVGKSLPGFTLDVEWQAGDGVAVLFGPSGSGKTLTLQCLAGLVRPDAGRIVVAGQVLFDAAAGIDVPPQRRRVGYVFQGYALFPHLTVRQNVGFGLRDRARAERRRRVDDVLGRLSLETHADRYPRELSGGQRQRVALGRAIVRNPRVFLFDEPLSNLDAKLRVQMRVELKRLHERLETTAIYVTHDQVEAMTLGDRVVVMKDGLVQQVGEPLELYGRPANRFVAGFIGSPAMNFAEVTVASRSDALWVESPGLRIRIPAAKTEALRPHSGNRIVLGIRPEALRLANGADPSDYAFDTTVEVVEPLGNEILLDVRAGGQLMVARVDPGVRVKVRDAVRLAVDPERLHFFDAKTEAAI